MSPPERVVRTPPATTTAHPLRLGEFYVQSYCVTESVVHFQDLDRLPVDAPVTDNPGTVTGDRGDESVV